MGDVVRFVILGAVALALGCVAGIRVEPVVRTSGSTALVEHGPPSRVALAPFESGPALARSPDAAGREGPILAARYVAEALEARGVDVVPAEDVRLVLKGTQPVDPEAIAALVADRFGADGVLFGVVHRWRPREGSAGGATRSASVSFDVVLRAAPGGEPLWRASFDETQKPLSENVLNAPRYPGGGTRWLTAEELARWGAGEVAAALPRGGGS